MKMQLLQKRINSEDDVLNDDTDDADDSSSVTVTLMKFKKGWRIK